MSQIIRIRCTIIALFVTVIAASWDIWWHAAFLRETFFSPPHLLLYISVVAAMILGWKTVGWILLLIPLSAPFDELWHRIFGVENIASLGIIWSPPHVLLALAVGASFMRLIRLLTKDPDTHARLLLAALAYAGIFSVAEFLVSPFEPTGPHALLGFWGAGIIAFVLVSTLIKSQRQFAEFGMATLTSIVIALLAAVSHHSGPFDPRLAIAPHDHAPLWLMIFSVVSTGAWVDTARRVSPWLKGGVAGLLWAGILFGFSSAFFAPQFQYPFYESLIAAIAGCIGGSIAGTWAFTISYDK